MMLKRHIRFHAIVEPIPQAPSDKSVSSRHEYQKSKRLILDDSSYKLQQSLMVFAIRPQLISYGKIDS